LLITSRSFQEYEAFFGLTSDDLAGAILDCSAGASGFAAAVNARGGRATAVDPAYDRGVEQLSAEASDAAARGRAILAVHRDSYVWSWYGTLERHEELRRTALAEFLADVRAHRETYVPGALPYLPFADGTFDLALCSHLLFTWSNVFDDAWHEAALCELLRVAREVRVFPLVVQGAGDAVPFLASLLDRVRGLGHGIEVVDVPYEFQRGACQMLRITAARRSA
jgi:SAM-dependent methyltransferase